MTAQPVWVTPAGTLGTLPEGIAYEVSLQSTAVVTLPIVSITGNTSVVTLTIARQLSTPFEVGDTIVVSGVTPSGYNGTFTVATVTNTLTTTRITYSSSAAGVATVLGTIATASSTIYYQLLAGQLPYGMTIDDAGLISGTPMAKVYIDGVATEVSYDVTSEFVVRAYTTKVVSTVTVVDRFCDQTFTITTTGAGAPQWVTSAGSLGSYYEGAIIEPGIQLEYTDNNTADVVVTDIFSGELPPGLSLNSTGLISGFVELLPTSLSETYEFTLSVSNGLVTNLRTFSISVFSIVGFTADRGAPPPPLLPPIELGYTADITTITADASSQVSPFISNPQGSIGTTRNDNYFAYQFFGIDLYGGTVSFVGTNVPPGLTLDPVTGWLYGYVINTTPLEQIYNFQVQAYPAGQPGLASQPYSYSLTVEAAVVTGVTWITPSNLGTISTGEPSTLFVEAVDVSDLTLSYRLDPTATNILPDGLTLQSDGTITGIVLFNPSVLDCSFTVNAYYESSPGVNAISVFKTFTVTVVETTDPYDNLYIKCMPPLSEYEYVQTFLTDTTIFTPDLIYRPDDINFGVAKNIVYYHAYGLTADTVDAYVNALNLNHYWKQLTLGQIKTARALDSSGNPLYEVIYCEVVDNLINNLGQTVNKEVVLPYPINPGTLDEIDVVFPNGLVNMRNQVIDQVGQVSNILPRWMTSKQTDGTVLGFTPAWVIAYCNPGASGRLLYNIEQSYPVTFNTIDFKADRYELDRSISDPVVITQFNPSYNPADYIVAAGSGYAVNDRINIPGTSVGGTNPANNVIITVTTVANIGNVTGAISSATCYGISNAVVGNTYNAIAGNTITGNGSGATFNLVVAYGATTDVNDAYLMYPKYNVVTDIPSN